MKNKGPKNPFSNATRLLFMEWHGFIKCFDCGRTDRGAELHHILKRVSASPLNAIPLCWKCHNAGDIHRSERQRKYLKRTFNYLQKIKYIFTIRDEKFLDRYMNLYA